MEENRLMHFVKSGLEAYGALVYRSRRDALETLMPLDLANRIGLKEDQMFGFGPVHQQNPNVEYISFNSEALERFSMLVDSAGFFSAMISGGLYLKQKGLEKLVSDKITFINSTYRFLGKKEAHSPYLLLNFKYTAVSEEKQEGIFPVIINEHTLNALSGSLEFERGLEENLRQVSSPDEIPRTLLDPKPLDYVIQIAHGSARSGIRKILTDFEKSLERRMQRDIERLSEYYQTIIQEIEKKIRKRKLSGEEKEREESRMSATEMELRRKVRDQHKRYSLKIQVDLVNGLRIYIPVICLDYEVHRKKARKTLTFIWNPLMKALELPTCQSCFSEAGGFLLCDDRLHLICTKCNEACPACGKLYCRICHPRKCPGCSRQSPGI